MHLLRRLSPHCAAAMESAAQLCQARSHGEIHLEHWLFKLVDSDDGDIPAILRHYDIDPLPVWQGLLDGIERLKQDLRGKPSLSAALVETLEDAWMIATRNDDAVIRSAHILASLADAPQRLRAPGAWSLLSVSAAQVLRLMPELGTASAEGRARPPSVQPPPAPGAPSAGDEGNPALNRFTIDLTQRAAQAMIDPVFGRELEIDQMIDILSRRRKNNPILIGDPGVGKTALVEGLALRIHDGNVPAGLLGARLLTLDLALLQAGAGVKGEFEQRLKQVIDDIRKSPTPIFLFIDEAHTIVGAGSAAGGADAANLLKPALARGELRTIAATTWNEYKEFFERDAALERRFQPVRIVEPDDERACLMLRGIVGRYASFHGVHIHDEAVVAAVRLSRRYITGRLLPDKAIDVIDTAAARVRKALESLPANVQERRAFVVAQELALSRATADAGAGMAVSAARRKVLEEGLRLARERCDELERAYATQRSAADAYFEHARSETSVPDSIAAARTRAIDAQGENPLVHLDVDARCVAAVVADLTGIPATKLMKDERIGLLSIEDRLGERVMAQDEALTLLANGIRMAKAGLTHPHAPLGVYLLAGPSGVGKTETARALADALFGGEASLVTINMSEYQEAHTVALLKGAPPGYVGYGRGGLLTEAIRQRPYCVLLLDEVEKAHRDVLDVFYQVFDRGSMRDAEGRHVDFRHCVILMTSNLGSDAILGACAGDNPVSHASLLDEVRPTLTRHFGAALMARFQTIIYRPLDAPALARISRAGLVRAAKRITDRFRMTLRWNDDLPDTLARACHVNEAGARHVESIIDEHILPPIASELLRHSPDTLPSIAHLSSHDGGSISIDFSGGSDGGGGDGGGGD